MVVQTDEPVALAVRQKSGLPNSSNRKPLNCSYCNRDNHVREKCWKLHGYPPGHSRNASTKRDGHTHPSVNHVKEDNSMMQQFQSVVNGLTDLQLQQMLSILQGNGSSQSATHKANNVTTTSGLSFPKLIIDSGATDHITSSPNLLLDSKENTS